MSTPAQKTSTLYAPNLLDPHNILRPRSKSPDVQRQIVREAHPSLLTRPVRSSGPFHSHISQSYSEKTGHGHHTLSMGDRHQRHDHITQKLSSEKGLFSARNAGFADVEAQKLRDRLSARPTPAAEYQIPTRIKLLYLASYFGLNLGLTIYNKAVLGGFHFPWILTTIHTSCVSLGCYFLMLMGHFKRSKLDSKENLVLVSFSTLFTLNIAISNVSLDLVSVPFHQIMRSTCPVFTILIYKFAYSRIYSTATYLSLIPIVIGVGLATYGDYYFTVTGFFLTLLGVVLASVKTVISNRLMTGSLALPVLEILLRMSPLAAVQALGFAFFTGESTRLLDLYRDGGVPSTLALALAGNGFLAFVLNISSFQTNKLAGALTLTVSGNLKQCLTVVLGIALFNVRVGLANGIGMTITLMGAAWYSKVELDSKGKILGP